MTTVRNPVDVAYATNYNAKSTVFTDIIPYITVKVNRRFEGTYYLHLQGRRVSHVRNHNEVSSCHLLLLLVFCLAYSSILKMENICASEMTGAH
jgi:hypothetical protein